MNEETTNKAIVKFFLPKFEKSIQQKVSVFCQQILSIQRLTLVSRRLKKNISNDDKTISFDRTSSETKITTESWYFNNFLQCKPDFFSVTKDLLTSLKSLILSNL